jgi:hypothetical protein
MAIKWPLANDVWSNAANWNDGTLPDVGDDVHADGKTVTIDQDVTVLSIRTDARSGGTAGGGFSITSGNWNIVTDILAGSSPCLTINNSLSIINITGNIIGGNTSFVNCVNLNNFNIVYFIGNITGGTFGQSSNGVIDNSSTSNSEIYITGNIFGGGGGNPNCVGFTKNSTLSTLFHTGIITGGLIGFSNHGIRIERGISYVDLVTASSNTQGLNSAQTTTPFPTVYVNKAVGSETNLALAGVVNTSLLAKVVVKEVGVSSINGWGVLGNILFANTLTTITALRENDQQILLQDFENLPDQLPLESDVRKGSLFNLDQKTGTMAVAAPSNVRKDVPVDDTVGTADLTAEDILNAILTSENPVAERLRNVSTVQTTGDQIAGS